MRNNELLLGLLLCCLGTLYSNLGTWEAPAIATPSPDDGHRDPTRLCFPSFHRCLDQRLQRDQSREGSERTQCAQRLVPPAHQPASFGGAGRMSLRHSTVTPRVMGEGRPLRSLRSTSQHQSRLPKLHLLRSRTLSFYGGCSYQPSVHSLRGSR